MTKRDVLASLGDLGEADAAELANTLGVPYATTAMALLRLVRQHLASRVIDPQRGLYAYQLTDHGHARLAFFEDEGSAPPGQTEATTSRRHSPLTKGGDLMKHKKLHSGTYHCRECLYEVTLTAEASLQCDDCKGRLYEGELPEEEEEEYEEED